MTEKEFFEELAENDRINKTEMHKKDFHQQSAEFADFIAKNHVKIKGGKK